ncbi:MAG: hypothetical protein ACLFQB_08390 [Chitinispirillaceae bacterium]
MQNRINAFAVIYTLELQDLKDHLCKRIAVYQKQFEDEKISSYVYRENRALLENEICGLDFFLERFRKMDLEKFSTVEELRDLLKGMNETFCAEEGIAYPVANMANKKADKITDYLRESQKVDEGFISYIQFR